MYKKELHRKFHISVKCTFLRKLMLNSTSCLPRIILELSFCANIRIMKYSINFSLTLHVIVLKYNSRLSHLLIYC